MGIEAMVGGITVAEPDTPESRQAPRGAGAELAELRQELAEANALLVEQGFEIGARNGVLLWIADDCETIEEARKVAGRVLGRGLLAGGEG